MESCSHLSYAAKRQRLQVAMARVALGDSGRMSGQYRPYPVGADIPFASVIFIDVRQACIFIENSTRG